MMIVREAYRDTPSPFKARRRTLTQGSPCIHHLSRSLFFTCQSWHKFSSVLGKLYVVSAGAAFSSACLAWEESL